MNEDKWLKCTKCNEPMKPVFTSDDDTFPESMVNEFPEQIEDGFKIIFSGGYNMFRDNVGEENYAMLCHDCVVELLEFFPESFKEKFMGSHPYNDVKCCRYTWSFGDE